MKFGQSPYWHSARQEAAAAAYDERQRDLENLVRPKPIMGRVLPMNPSSKLKDIQA